jgi:EmrB/QacA subfamily drug resistance transporter
MTDQRVQDRVAGVEAARDRAMTSRGNRKWWALGAVCLGCLAVGVDGTVLSVALPTLSKALNASESDLQWFMSIYFLVMAASMLPAGLLGDRFGRKRVMLIALGLFALESAGSALSTSVAEFMAARVLMGMAGAGIIVMAVSAVTVLFSARERPKAVGFWAVANFISFPIGPILGGWMLTEFWWGWVFLINVPVALLGLTALIALVPETRAAKRPGIDILGIAASAAGLVTLTYGLIEAGQNGWGDIGALTLMIVGVAVLVGFLVWERRLSRLAGGQPLLDMKLFTSASFTWGVILAALPVLAMISILFTLPQYFQGVVGTNAMGSGLRLLPMIAGLMLGAIPAAQVVRVVGAKVVVEAGFFLLAVGLLVGAMTSLGSTGLFTAAWMFVAGVGGDVDGHRHLRSARRAVTRAQRCRLGDAAGGQQDRWSDRHRDPRERAERWLPRGAAPGRAPGRSGDRHPSKHLRRRGGRGQARLGVAARLGAHVLCRRHGYGAPPGSRQRRGRRRGHHRLPPPDQCCEGDHGDREWTRGCSRAVPARGRGHRGGVNG